MGALFVKKGIEIEPLIHGGSQEAGLRASTENVPGIVGFGRAAELALAAVGQAERVLNDLETTVRFLPCK